MKASELTQGGFYWYRGTYPEFDGPTSYGGQMQETDGWVIALFDADPQWEHGCLSIHNDQNCFGKDQLSGDFIGPILSPDHADYFHLVEYVIRENGEPTRVRCQLSEIPDWAQHLF
jgi:hypothetical protein